MSSLLLKVRLHILKIHNSNLKAGEYKEDITETLIDSSDIQYTQVPSKCDVLGDLIFLLELRLKIRNSAGYYSLLIASQAKKSNRLKHRILKELGYRNSLLLY